MTKSPDAFRTISEVSEWLATPAHVLRFWESRFPQVKPVKRAGGRRYYRPADMLLLGGIKCLLHDDGMTIKGVQKVLREEGVKHVATLSHPLDASLSDQVEAQTESADRIPSATPRKEDREEDNVVPLTHPAAPATQPEAEQPQAVVTPVVVDDIPEPVSARETTPATPLTTAVLDDTSNKSAGTDTPKTTDTEQKPVADQQASKTDAAAHSAPQQYSGTDDRAPLLFPAGPEKQVPTPVEQDEAKVLTPTKPATAGQTDSPASSKADVAPAPSAPRTTGFSIKPDPMPAPEPAAKPVPTKITTPDDPADNANLPVRPNIAAALRRMTAGDALAHAPVFSSSLERLKKIKVLMADDKRRNPTE